MEVKSVSDCLNIIDDNIVEDVNTISNLESIPKYLLEREHSYYIEDRVALSNVLRRINSITDNYNDFAENVRSEYVELKRLILVGLSACNTKPEVEDQK